MRRPRLLRLSAALAAAALVAAGCGGDDDTASGPGTTRQRSDVKVGLAYDIGGRGDRSFNDSAALGLDRAKQELGFEARELSAAAGETNADKEARLNLLAEAGYNPILAIGFAYAEPVKKVAAARPGVRFAIVDDASATGPNIANLTFAEEQCSYLVGVAAALKSTTGNVGFIGGVQVPLIKKFEAGYTAGVRSVKPDATVQVRYLTQPPDFTGFNDAAKARLAADGMYDNGADVVYHAAGGSGGGLFESAKAKGKLAIGVDQDQYHSADPAVRDVILTSAIKRVDTAVYTFLSQTLGDEGFKAGEQVFDLRNDGVGYATSGGRLDDIEDQIEKAKDDIVSGRVTVPEA